MRVKIFNCNSDVAKDGIDAAAQNLADKLTTAGHNVTLEIFREKSIKDCIGCFGCWVKTPGECVHNDDMKDVLKGMLNSDVQIIVSDSRFGMVSPLVTSVINRFLPMVCAYMFIDSEGKTSHYPRYDNKSKFALLVEDFGECTENRLNDISYCLHQNNKEDYLGTYVIGKNEEEIINAFNSN
ncbi:MAG: NAD(P)H-dependent oxidoreductase [Spirochaetes bacterium]|jgi:multimeric flavodoxin WrbA|nr:NAD(P)H-dependent oxidoreductase [Spirochaetota bacterium]